MEYMRSEMNTQFANIATPNEVIVSTTFGIEIGASHGEFHCCMPYSMIEPIRDLLTSSMQGETLDIDKRWTKLMTQQIQNAEVEIVANMGSADISIKELIDMQVGDVIPINIPDIISATIDQIPIMECSYGTLHGQYALRVEKLLSHNLSDGLHPDSTQGEKQP